MIGEYEGSGYKEPHYIARRSDGQVIQLSELLHLVASKVDGSRDYKAIAEEVSSDFGRRVSHGNVQFLIEKKLRPLGVIKGADGSEPDVKKLDPLLALKFRTAVVPGWLTKALTTIFKPLFWPPVIVAALLALGALDYWLFAVHGVAQSARNMLYEPAFLLIVFGLVILSAAFHEIGHATALRYGGGEPSVMGVGIYLVWPAFYTDVTDAYRLGRGGRLRTDLGGIYFNGIFSLITFGAYFLTGFEPLLLVIALQHVEVLHQLLPFLRLDGYYIVADLTGVPDMFARIKPILKSLIPGKKTADSVKELKPWVRAVVTVWVLTLIPILLYVFGVMILSMPRILATAWDSLLVQYDKVSAALGDGQAAQVAAGSLQMTALALPGLGMFVSFGRLGNKIRSAMWKRTDGRPVARSAFVVASLTLLAAIGWVLYPNGEYKPLQPGERGTIGDGLQAISSFTTGRPGLTEEREEELEGAPTLREDSDSTTTQDPGGSTEDPAPSSEDTTDDDTTSTDPSPTPTTEEPTPTTSPTPVSSPTP